jgi:hypothetical protein
MAINPSDRYLALGQTLKRQSDHLLRDLGPNAFTSSHRRLSLLHLSSTQRPLCKPSIQNRTFRFREEFRTPLGIRKSPKHEPAVNEQGLWGFRNLGESCGASAAVSGLDNTAIRAVLADEQELE